MDIKRLPKIDLHCHLDGSLSLSVIQRHIGIPVTKEMLSVPDDCKSLAEYLEKFELPVRCLQDADGLMDGAYTFIKEAAEENIKYVEVRFAPMLSAGEKLDCATVIEAVRDGLRKGSRECKVRFGIITCAMRNHTEAQNLEMLRTARDFLGDGVCALDLAGDEAAYPNEQFRELFDRARELGMPFVIHSGETGDEENVRSALEFGASRIGHGIAMKKDPALMEACAEKKVGVEMCPTSNFQTKAVKSWEEYPLADFLDAGVLVSVNTDNRTVSGTTMTKELTKVYDQYGKDGNLILKLLENAAATAFDREIKEMYERVWKKEIGII